GTRGGRTRGARLPYSGGSVRRHVRPRGGGIGRAVPASGASGFVVSPVRAGGQHVEQPPDVRHAHRGQRREVKPGRTGHAPGNAAGGRRAGKLGGLQRFGERGGEVGERGDSLQLPAGERWRRGRGVRG